MSETNHVRAIRAVAADIADHGGVCTPVYPRTPSCDLMAGGVYLKIRTPVGVRSATVAERTKMFSAIASHTPDALMLVGTVTSRIDLWEVWGDLDVLAHLVGRGSGPLPEPMGLAARLTWRDLVRHIAAHSLRV